MRGPYKSATLWFRYFIGTGTAAAGAADAAVVSKNIAARLYLRDVSMLVSAAGSAAGCRKRLKIRVPCASELVLPVVGHAGKSGSQVRPDGGRCHCADRGDAGGRTAAQRRPAEDNGVGKLAGAGVGEVSGRQPRPRLCSFVCLCEGFAMHCSHCIVQTCIHELQPTTVSSTSLYQLCY